MNNLREQLWRRLPTGGFARSVAVLVGGTALGQSLTVLASPLLTRLYTPQDFGVLAVYASILGIVTVVASLRYELAIPLPEDGKIATNLLALSLAIAVGTSLLVGIGLWFLGDQVVDWTNIPVLRPYLWLLPLGMLGAAMYQIFNYWAIRGQAFRQIARTKVNQSLGQIITQLLLGWGKVAPLGLLLGHFVGLVVGSGTLAALALGRDRKKVIEQISSGRISQAAYRYRGFPFYSSGSALLNSAVLYLPTLLLTAFYGLQVAGWFALGQRVIGLPLTLIGQSVTQVYTNEAARLARQDMAAMRALFLKTVTKLFLAGLVPISLLALSGPWLFATIFGVGWIESGVYVRILALMFAVQFAVSPPSQALNIIERQGAQLGWDVFRVLLTVGAFIGAHILDWSRESAIAAYGAVMLIAYAMLFEISRRILTRMADGGRLG